MQSLFQGKHTLSLKDYCMRPLIVQPATNIFQLYRIPPPSSSQQQTSRGRFCCIQLSLGAMHSQTTLDQPFPSVQQILSYLAMLMTRTLWWLMNGWHTSRLNSTSKSVLVQFLKSSPQGYVPESRYRRITHTIHWNFVKEVLKGTWVGNAFILD